MDNDINTNSCCRSITRDVGRHLFASRFLKQCPVDQTAPTETMENINLICHSRALYEKGVQRDNKKPDVLTDTNKEKLNSTRSSSTAFQIYSNLLLLLCHLKVPAELNTQMYTRRSTHTHTHAHRCKRGDLVQSWRCSVSMVMHLKCLQRHGKAYITLSACKPETKWIIVGVQTHDTCFRQGFAVKGCKRINIYRQMSMQPIKPVKGKNIF